MSLLGKQVKVTSHHLLIVPFGTKGTVIEARPHFKTGHPEDDQVPDSITIQTNEGKRIGLTENMVELV